MTSGREDDLELERAVEELQDGVRAEQNSRLLFEHYYPWVRRFFRRLGYTEQDSEDLAQDTLERVLRQIGAFRGEGSFKSWLFASASNLHRNEHRRLHREKRNAPEVSIDATTDDGARLYEPAALEASPAREVYEREREEALARAVKALPPHMRHVLTMRIGQGLKYREIATVLHISVETVKAHLFQARQRLRAELGEDFGEWVD
jgi:RNA polymerase sigma-70 factor (ECF subfamily)